MITTTGVRLVTNPAAATEAARVRLAASRTVRNPNRLSR
jgi:hypothetical protein